MPSTSVSWSNLESPVTDRLAAPDIFCIPGLKLTGVASRGAGLAPNPGIVRGPGIWAVGVEAYPMEYIGSLIVFKEHVLPSFRISSGTSFFHFCSTLQYYDDQP